MKFTVNLKRRCRRSQAWRRWCQHMGCGKPV